MGGVGYETVCYSRALLKQSKREVKGRLSGADSPVSQCSLALSVERESTVIEESRTIRERGGVDAEVEGTERVNPRRGRTGGEVANVCRVTSYYVNSNGCEGPTRDLSVSLSESVSSFRAFSRHSDR